MASCGRSRSKSPRRSRSLSPAKNRSSSSSKISRPKTPQVKKKGRPRIKPIVRKSQKVQKPRGRPKRGEGPSYKTPLPPLPNSDYTREEITAMFQGPNKPKKRVDDNEDDEENERLSEASYHPPGEKIQKIKKQKPVTENISERAPMQVQQPVIPPKENDTFEIARLILLTPLDFTQASFTSQPILTLHIRNLELNKLISNSWHFIRTSQLFYSAINHNIPEISGTITINSDFISPSELIEEEEEELIGEPVKELIGEPMEGLNEEKLYIEEDSDEFELENILGMNDDDFDNNQECLRQ